MTRKSTSPLRAAIEKPLPASLAAAADKAKTATAAFHAARGAIDQFRSQQFTDNIAKLEGELAEVAARLDVARYLGEPASFDDLESVERLQADLQNAVTRRTSRKALEAGLNKAIDERRQAVDLAANELDDALTAWRDGVLAAADQQIADAVAALGEALGIGYALRPLVDRADSVRIPRMSGPGNHDVRIGGNLPAEVDDALTAWSRANRILTRV